jgi:hypothetical protein
MLELIILLVFLGLAYYLITLLPLPEPFPVLIKVVVILAVLFYLFAHFRPF